MPEENNVTVDLEIKLAAFVRSYFHASHAGESDPEALRWVCAAMEFLLGDLLEGAEGWSGWVDGILPATDMLPDAVTIVSECELHVRGSALWRNASGCWIEPFFGSVRIAANQDQIVRYELMFADARQGLGRVRYDKHLRWVDWFFPLEWEFTFIGGSASPSG